MKKALGIILATIALNLIAPVVHADTGGAFFTNDAAIRYFTDKDWQIFQANMYNALNNYQDGSTLTWQNPQSNASGSFTPSATTQQNGTVCRKLTIVNNAQHRTGQSTYKFCKINNAWKTL